jgi:hypothetical protein
MGKFRDALDDVAGLGVRVRVNALDDVVGNLWLSLVTGGHAAAHDFVGGAQVRVDGRG